MQFLLLLTVSGITYRSVFLFGVCVIVEAELGEGFTLDRISGSHLAFSKCQVKIHLPLEVH